MKNKEDEAKRGRLKFAIQRKQNMNNDRQEKPEWENKLDESTWLKRIDKISLEIY